MNMGDGMSYNGGGPQDYNAMLASSMANDITWNMGSQLGGPVPNSGMGMSMADQMATNESLMARGLGAQAAGMHMGVGLPAGLQLAGMGPGSGVPGGSLGGFLGGNLDGGLGANLVMNGQQLVPLAGSLGGVGLEQMMGGTLGGNPGPNMVGNLAPGMGPNLGANMGANMGGSLGPAAGPSAQQAEAMAAAAMFARIHGLGAMGGMHVGSHQRLPVDQAMDAGTHWSNALTISKQKHTDNNMHTCTYIH